MAGSEEEERDTGQVSDGTSAKPSRLLLQSLNAERGSRIRTDLACPVPGASAPHLGASAPRLPDR